MIIKCDDRATWVGFESAREIILFAVTIGSAVHLISDELINERIHEAAKMMEYDETDLVVMGIDAASAKEFAQELCLRVAHADENSGQ